MFIDEGSKLNRSVEPKDGRVSAFTSGPENRHMVEPVSGGTRYQQSVEYYQKAETLCNPRYALTMGFTCDPSEAIADPGTST